MKIFNLTPNDKSLETGTLVTIGNFDGVHLGHQALVTYALNKAKEQRLSVLVLLFEPQPKEFFNKTQAPVRIFGLREKLWSLKQIGVHFVGRICFNQHFASLTPRDFFEFLIRNCHAKSVVIGPDFYFGQGRSGSPTAMQQLAEQAKIPLEIYDFHHLNGERVSSTLIRNLLQRADFAKVEHFLSQPYFMLGRVIRGQQLGRVFGVPTANIRISNDKTALNGVFCVKIVSSCLKSQAFGVANLGYRPTVDGKHHRLEVHIFDCDQDLYDQFLQVFFLHKLRDEKKFDSLEDLKQQIFNDLQCARTYFGMNDYA
jgi:riboflavin kinase/FMN adenylyltransferase